MGKQRFDKIFAAISECMVRTKRRLIVPMRGTRIIIAIAASPFSPKQEEQS